MSIILQLDIDVQDPLWEEKIDNLTQTTNDICLKTLQATPIANDIDSLECEISVVLTEDATIKALNKHYRHQDKATNVLSFPQAEIDEGVIASSMLLPHMLLGDIIVSFPTLEREAKEKHISIVSHYRHLLVHGTLHLLGYDHNQDEEAERMENLEITILEQVGVDNPYGNAS